MKKYSTREGWKEDAIETWDDCKSIYRKLRLDDLVKDEEGSTSAIVIYSIMGTLFFIDGVIDILTEGLSSSTAPLYFGVGSLSFYVSYLDSKVSRLKAEKKLKS